MKRGLQLAAFPRSNLGLTKELHFGGRILITANSDPTGGPGPTLNGVGRCPFCSVVDPNMERQWASAKPTTRTDGKRSSYWAAYKCKTCGAVASVECKYVENSFHIVAMYPSGKRAHEDIPEPARTFLHQAYETLHAPDAAAMMAGSAVDGMLKA